LTAANDRGIVNSHRSADNSDYPRAGASRLLSGRGRIIKLEDTFH